MQFGQQWRESPNQMLAGIGNHFAAPYLSFGNLHVFSF